MAIVFNSANTQSVRENLGQNSLIYSTDAINQDAAGTLSYTLSGADAGLLTIDSETGEVRVVGGTDFETRSDYNFTVTVSNLVDGEVITTNSIDVVVTVEDAIEGTSEDDTYTASIGDVYDGLEGVDTVLVSGVKADFNFAKTGDNELTISNADDETIILRNIKHVQFDDETLTLNSVNTQFTDEFSINSITDNSQSNP